jgi:hypothetical protein
MGGIYAQWEEMFEPGGDDATVDGHRVNRSTTIMRGGSPGAIIQSTKCGKEVQARLMRSKQENPL